MTANTTAWGGGAKALHWLIALMILVEVPAGYLMAGTYGLALRHPDVRPLHVLMSQIHHTNGLLILALVLARLGWRAGHPTPALPPEIGAAHRGLARLTQGFLYALLIAIPLTGWAALSALADSAQFGRTDLWFFASDQLPRLPFIVPKPFNDPSGYRLVGGMHRILIYGGGGLLALHVLAALWHHLVRRDSVLLSMWPGAALRKSTDFSAG